MASNTNTTELFPEPNQNLLQPLVGTPPKTWAGVTPASTSSVVHILKDNHERWHIFCNELRFHNHTVHTVLALWSLGANETILEAAYKQSNSIQRPAFKSPGLIDANNWKERLGDEKYYNAYLKFFTSEIEAKGSGATFDEYVFSKGANVKGAGSNEEPCMVTRLVEGVLHSLIHAGYGFEFGMPGLVVEVGIAQAAVHPGRSNSKIIPESLFDENAAFKPTQTHVHALTVLARILADPRFETGDNIDQFKFYKLAHDNHGDAINEYVDQWTLDGPIENKVEELIWMAALIYGVGGHQSGKPFNNDFFLMHILNSSLFLSSLVSPLSRSSQEILLRAYMATCLVLYVGRGRPPIEIQRFYNETTTSVIPPGVAPSLHKAVFPSPASEYAVTPNPWFPILQTTLVHPDDHLVKLQRALSHYASVYGSKGSGYLVGTELKGTEILDGSLFVRIAILAAGKTGWIREGEAPVGFDMSGFYRTAAQGDNAVPYAVYDSIYYKRS
ncbi:hypothetical protein BDQ17DRAFT_1249219 [Cyathus striatus]|nr:hypothetical protein BDQ17DRAFT_1249219 [Cyathus striatus]